MQTTHQKLAFDMEVNFQATCTSDTGNTTWTSATGVRQMSVKGIDVRNTKTGTMSYGIEVKDAQDNGAFQYGPRWDGDCVSEEFKGTWTAGTTTCDSTGGTLSGQDCIDLFRAVEASICWSVASPRVCVDTMTVSGTLSASAQLKLVAADRTVSSDPTSLLDTSGYYSCSGEEVEVKADSGSVSACLSRWLPPSFLLTLLGYLYL